MYLTPIVCSTAGKIRPTSEPAAAVVNTKEIIAEEDTPWRRSGSLRSRQQQESPPKNRNYFDINFNFMFEERFSILFSD